MFKKKKKKEIHNINFPFLLCILGCAKAYCLFHICLNSGYFGLDH